MVKCKYRLLTLGIYWKNVSIKLDRTFYSIKVRFVIQNSSALSVNNALMFYDTRWWFERLTLVHLCFHTDFRRQSAKHHVRGGYVDLNRLKGMGVDVKPDVKQYFHVSCTQNYNFAMDTEESLVVLTPIGSGVTAVTGIEKNLTYFVPRVFSAQRIGYPCTDEFSLLYV